METETTEQLPVGSKGLDFKMEQELWTPAFVLVLLRTVGLYPRQKEEMVFETEVCHSPRSRST